MSAPKVIWVNEWGDWQDDSDGTNVSYIRADAPELVALVKAAKIMVAGYEGDNDGTITGYYALKSALGAWEKMK